MKFGVATFFTGQGIGPAALAQALEERGFDSLSSPNTPISRPRGARRTLPVANCPKGTTGCSTPSWR
jgi:hypothetical protein